MADCIEPAHAHVSGGGGACKIWLRPISMARSAGYSRREENAILDFAHRYEGLLLRRWNEICPPPA